MQKHIMDDGVFESHQLNYFYFASYLFFFSFIVFGNFPAFSHPRWYTGLDINQDGVVSITDFVKWALWIFYMPGDVLIQSFIVFPGTAKFFELGDNSYGNLGSFIFSLVYWHIMGGKRLVLYWFIILGLIIMRNVPSLIRILE